MKIKKVLWPTDFSSLAEKALPSVTSLTEEHQAEVHVLYVIEDTAHHESWYGEFGEKNTEKLMNWADKSARKRLGQICDKYLKGCPLYFRHVAIGDPAQEILKLIDEEHMDVVVMASHGKKGQFRPGSITQKVLKNTSVPVMSIPMEGGLSDN